jgi:hypothetical protein
MLCSGAMVFEGWRGLMMSQDIPVQADAYVLRWLLHDWSDEETVVILKNLKRVAKRNARVMLVESVGNARVRHGQVDGRQHAGDAHREGTYCA